ncbi:MAG: nucleotidyltransferase family protein, partial [Steroidobacteraceae bacterium]
MLRKITERFAWELADPAPLAPDWSEFEWIVARAVAAMHGVSPLLSRTLRWHGPVGWAEFLEEQRAHTTRRHARIADLLQRLARGARENGVAAVALKGASLHAMGLYAAGDRPMADIDVLVRPRDVRSAGRLLTSMGFRQTRESWKEREFTPVDDHIPGEFGENADNSVKIELHDRICERLPWRITDMSERIFPPHPQPGLQGYPSKASMMIHLLLHAAGSMTT